MIVDASVVLAAFFPDEHQACAQALFQDHLAGDGRLCAPTLLLYEITNGIVQAIRRGRIAPEEGEAVLASIGDLGIELLPVEHSAVLRLAQRFGRTAYDAAYLALAEARAEPLVTGDLRLYNAVHPELEGVRWIGDVTGPAPEQARDG